MANIDVIQAVTKPFNLNSYVFTVTNTVPGTSNVLTYTNIPDLPSSFDINLLKKSWVSGAGITDVLTISNITATTITLSGSITSTATNYTIRPYTGNTWIRLTTSSNTKIGYYISGAGIPTGTTITAVYTGTPADVFLLSSSLTSAMAGDYTITQNTATPSITFQYDPPPSIAGKICKCYVTSCVTNSNSIDSLLFFSTWTQINSILLNYDGYDPNVYYSNPVGFSNIIGFVSISNSSTEHTVSYVRIPDGPHEVKLQIQAETAFAAGTQYTVNYRVHLEPMDSNYHYERLTSNKTGPSIII